ncbi:MAG: sporulation protein YqfD [Firmicutes bacterium]|jgi:similar to stage IV sporulation protein|nr:sporulation protein YqfD [Bacillota bacterium]
MSLSGIGRLLAGCLRIEIRGATAERFVNLAVSRGIAFWNVRRGPGYLQADIRIGAFRSLRDIARKTRSRVRIKSRRGLPFLLGRWRGRHGFLAGLAACAFAILFVSSRVWFVEVSGATTQTRAQEVLGIAAECGLRPGAATAGLDLREIELGILSKAEYVSWARLRVQGTRVIVEIIEKTLPPAPSEEDLRPCDLVARVPGTVHEILVYMGEPAVKVGDSVAAGQTLIEGRIKGPPVERKPGSQPGGATPTADKPVRARGKVIARVARVSAAEEQFVQWVEQRSGRTYSRRVVRLPGKDIIWKGRQPVPFARYEAVSRVRSLCWRNIPLPVESITETFYELVQVKTEVGREEAKERARIRALESARAQVPAGADVVGISAESSESDSAVNVTVTITTLEDIGMPGPAR